MLPDSRPDYPSASPPPDPLIDRIARMEERVSSYREQAGSIAERLDGIEGMLGAAEERLKALYAATQFPGLAMPSPQTIGRVGGRPY